MLRAIIRFIRDRRGSAATEALVVTPVVAIIWAGIILNYNTYEDAVDTAAEVRRCALTTATSGCRGGCASGGGSLSMSDIVSEMIPGFDRFMSLIRTIFSFLRPILGALDNLGWAQHGATANIRIPSVLGGGSRSVDILQEFQCREVPLPDAGDVLRRLFCKYTPFC